MRSQPSKKQKILKQDHSLKNVDAFFQCQKTSDFFQFKKSNIEPEDN